MRRFAIVLFALVLAAPAAADPVTPESEIGAALAKWTADFNSGRTDEVCGLFAPVLHADVRGAPERDFAAQCALLKKALADPDRTYAYAFALKEVVCERDMAVVRLTWTTTTRVKATGQVSTSFDEGLDVFGRGSDGTWRIIRYMAYERP